MTHAEFRARMQNVRTEELVRITESGKDEFEREAIQAAREELAARGLTISELVELREEAHELSAREQAAPERPLSTGVRLVFVAFGPLLISSMFGIFVFVALFTRGYKRMAREAFNASAVGLLLWLVILAAIWRFA